jgi:hypothetical protein
MRTGIAELPLHGGKVPAWLLSRMENLSKILVTLIVEEYGTLGLLERISDPVYFQAINNIIGMDWDSSGSTTVTTAIIKRVLSREELGVRACGGKGVHSREAPDEIRKVSEEFGLDASSLVRTSRLVAKIDNTALQSGYQLYHHVFFVDEEGNWAVVQQGMNTIDKMARRYHWLSTKVSDFTRNPHSGIQGRREPFALNTIADDSHEFRKLSVELIKDEAEKLPTLFAEANRILEGYVPLTSYVPYDPHKVRELREKFRRLGKPFINKDVWFQVKEVNIDSFSDLLLLKNVGPATMRGLALVAELVYEVQPSWRDPVTHPPVDPFKFAYAVGGKDGVPFPIDRKQYDELLSILSELMSRVKGDAKIMKRLAALTRSWAPPPEEKIPT